MNKGLFKVYCMDHDIGFDAYGFADTKCASCLAQILSSARSMEARAVLLQDVHLQE